MRYGTGLGLLAVILAISPGVVAQEETPSPAQKASAEAGARRKGERRRQEKTKFDRPGRRFGGDAGAMPARHGRLPHGGL